MSWNWKVIWLTSSWLLDGALRSLVVTFLLSFLGWLVVERLLNEPSSQGVRMLLWSMKVFGESDSHIFDLMWLNHLIKRLLPSFVLSVYWELLTAELILECINRLCQYSFNSAPCSRTWKAYEKGWMWVKWMQKNTKNSWRKKLLQWTTQQQLGRRFIFHKDNSQKPSQPVLMYHMKRLLLSGWVHLQWVSSSLFNDIHIFHLSFCHFSLCKSLICTSRRSIHTELTLPQATSYVSRTSPLCLSSHSYLKQSAFAF